MTGVVSDWDAIEALFDAAMAQPAAEREAYLHSHATTQADFQRALRLVRASELATGFLSTRVAREPAVSTLAVDARIGEWRVIEPIAIGGMGEVYKVARDTGEFEQLAALKLVRPDLDDVEQRFALERRISARLNHPNIARLIDGGRADDGRLYMVVDLVEGDSLIDYANAHSLTERERLGRFVNLCEAVGYAHGAFILHRDIKPQNVLVNDDGTLKLIDFGIAYFLDDEQQTTSAPLTVAYAAPEQLEGRAVTVATDVYALGVVLHELLTGTRPGDDLSTALPTDLRSIVARCLEPDPAARYRSVEALREDVERYLRAEPVLAHAGGTLYRLAKLGSRYRVAFGAISVMLVGLAAALLFSLQANRETEAALQQVKASGEQWRFEARTTRGLRLALLQVYGAQGEDGQPISSEEIDRRLLVIAKEAEQAARDGDLQQAHDMFAIGGHFMRRFEHEKAIDVYQRLLATGVESPMLRLETQSSLAWSLDKAGRTEEALALAQEVIETRGDLSASRSRNVVQSEQIVAAAADTDTARDDLINSLRAAIADEAERPPQDRFYTRWYYNQIGFLHLRSGDYDAAARAFVEELKHGRELGVRSLEMVTTATNAAQGQIYVLREGAEPLEYLPDYLVYTNGERGDDPARWAFMQSLIADAALLVGDQERANSASQLALDALDTQRDHRYGVFYQAMLSQVRSRVAAGDIQSASALVTEIQSDPPPDTAPSQQVANCMLAFAESALAHARGDVSAAAVAYDRGFMLCQGGSDRPMRAPLRFHADGIRTLIAN